VKLKTKKIENPQKYIYTYSVIYNSIANIKLKLNMALFFIFGQPLDSYSGIDRGINICMNTFLMIFLN